MEVISELLRLLGMLSTRTVLALYNSKVLLNLLLNGDAKLCPSILSEKQDHQARLAVYLL
jgi:hypothetical protein